MIVALMLLLAFGWWWHERGQPLPVAALKSGLPGSAAPAAAPVRCTAPDGRVSYTDGRCPEGHRAQAVAGQVTVLPGTRPAAAAAAPASAQTPLRRLAGEGAVPDLAERQVEQALKR